jgi:hypothetical protein
MFDLIHTQNETATALDFQTVVDNCPAVLTGSKSPDTSDRYGFVSTMGAMQLLGDYGFRPVKAVQRPSRKSDLQPFAAHMISFCHDYDLAGAKDNRPELIIYNSHDGKSALKLFAGIYRFICSNGIIAGNGFDASMRHSNKTANGFEDLLKSQANALPGLMERIDSLQNTKLEQEQALDFAYNATKLRWEFESDVLLERIHSLTDKPLRGSYATEQTVQSMLTPLRRGDFGCDAWTVFNVAQEKLIRGGSRVISHTARNADNYGGTIRKARGISSLPEIVRINRKLWDLAAPQLDQTELMAAE